MPKNENEYNNSVSLQKDNQENKGDLKNQNENHNAIKEALGPNTRRNK